MATSFPASLDSLTNPTSGQPLSSPSHSTQHANANDAIEAIETALGTDSQRAGLIQPYAGFTAPTGWLLCYGQAVSRSTYATLFSIINPSLGTFTVTIASPGVFTLTAHGLVAGDSVYLTTTGALPTGLSANTRYYVIAAGLTANAFEVSATYGGSAINTSGSQSGVHTIRRTPYGLGDGSTTFNIPDLRGRTIIGADNMGGTGADRVVAAQADNLGQAAGEENHQLTIAELAAHTHNVGNADDADATGSGFRFAGNTGDAVSASTGGDTAHNTMQPYLTLNYLIRY